MKVHVLYFAVARELAGLHEEEITLADRVTVADARRAIESLHPSLASSDGRLRIARNEAFADDTELLADGDVIALIPPVAGG